MAKHITAYGAKAIKKVRKKTPPKTEQMPGPTENPATNLMMVDVAIRAGSYIARRSIEKGMLRGRYGKDTAREIVQNKTLGQTLVSFGLAKLADQLMDTWMKNATLNANAAVAPWTESGQRQGFKFLVTQVPRRPRARHAAHRTPRVRAEC